MEENYRTPNGNVLTRDELISQYGEEGFQSFLNDGKLTLVDGEDNTATEEVFQGGEDIYITPNGNEVTTSELVNQYGEEKFNSFVTENKIKKKEQGELGSQSEYSNGESEPTEQDYFEGGFGDVLRGFDAIVPLGLGDFIDDTARAVSAGYNQGTMSENAADVLFAGNMSTDEDLSSFIEANKRAQQLGSSAEMMDYQRIYEKNGKGFLGVVLGIANNPSVVSELIVSSMVGMATNSDALVAAGSIIGGGAAIGASTAGTAGTFVVPGLGTAVGAGAGAITGAIASLPYAFAAAGTVLEFGATFAELLQEEVGEGVDLTPDNIRRVLNDEDTYTSIRNKALARGLAIGAIDAFTGKMGGKLAGKIVTRGGKQAIGDATKKQVLKGLAASSGVEAVGGSIGEASARGLIGQEMDVSEIALEGIAEMPGGVKNLIATRYTKPTYTVNKEKVDAATVDNLIETMTLEELVNTKIDIKNDFEGRQGKLQDKIVSLSTQREIASANPELNKPTLVEITRLQLELNKLDATKTEVGKAKAADIRDQIKDLQVNQLEEETSTSFVSGDVVEEEEVVSSKTLSVEEQFAALDAQDKLELQERAINEMETEMSEQGIEEYNLTDKMVDERATEIFKKEVLGLKENTETTLNNRDKNISERSDDVKSQFGEQHKSDKLPYNKGKDGKGRAEIYDITKPDDKGVVTAEYASPEGVVDVIISGIDDNNFVGYTRVYENGEQTNMFTAKMESTGTAFKNMITSAEAKLPDNAEVVETTSISEGGLKVYNNSKLTEKLDEDGSVVTRPTPYSDATKESVKQDGQSAYKPFKTTDKAAAEAEVAKIEAAYPGINANINERKGAPSPPPLPGQKAPKIPARKPQYSISIDLPVLIKANAETEGGAKFSLAEDGDALVSVDATDSELIQEEMNNEFPESEVNFVSTPEGGSVTVSPFEESNSTEEFTDADAIEMGFESKEKAVQPIENFNGIPMITAISDTAFGGVGKDSKGKPMKGNGGVMFNALARIKAAWAGVKPSVSEGQYKNAVKLYKKNKPLFDRLWKEGRIPNGQIPMAVIRMGNDAINSNEIVFRYLSPEINAQSKENQTAAMNDLLKVLESKKGKFAPKLVKFISDKKVTTLGGLMDAVVADANTRAKGDIDNTLTLDTRAALYSVMVSPETKTGKPVTPNKPFLKSLYKGTESNFDLFTSDNVYKAVGEPSMMKSKKGDVVSIVGVDVIDGGVIDIDHGNYGTGPKGGLIALISNPTNGMNVFPEWKAKASRVFKENTAGKTPSKKTSDAQVGGTAANDKAFQGAKVNTGMSDVDVLAAKFRFAFPGVPVVSTKAEFEAALKEPGVRTKVSEGKTILGMTKDGKIFLNPDQASLGTPIHEFGHVWIDFLRSKASGDSGTALLNRGLKLVEGTKALEVAIEKYGDNKLAREEALVELMANKGETIIDAGNKSKFLDWLNATFKYIQKKFVKSEKLFAKEDIKNLKKQLKKNKITQKQYDSSLKKIQASVKKSIASLTIEDFINTGLADLFGGKELSASFDAKKESKGIANRLSFTEEESSLQSDIEQYEIEIEDLNFEIENVKSEAKEDIAKIDSQIKEVRSSSMDKESKAERIEELKSEKIDLKEDRDTEIDSYKEDISILKKDRNRAQRRLNKLSSLSNTEESAPVQMAAAPVVEEAAPVVEEAAPVVIENEAEILTAEIQGVIDRRERNNGSVKNMIAKIDKMVRDSAIYRSLDDAGKKKLEDDARAQANAPKKRAPSRGRIVAAIDSVLQDFYTTTNIDTSSKLKIANKLIQLAKSAQKDLSAEIKAMRKKGVITTAQQAAVINRMSKVNFLNETSISSFVEYMSRVFANADYANTVAEANSKRKTGKKNASGGKLGVAQALAGDLQRIFSVNARIIPESVLENYMKLIGYFGNPQAVLELPNLQTLTMLTEDVINTLDAETSLVVNLKEVYDAYEKVLNKDKSKPNYGKVNYAATIESMKVAEVITAAEAELMMKYKSDIVPATEKKKLSEEEIQEQKEQAKRDIDFEIADYNPNNNDTQLPSRLEREDVKSLIKLARNNEALDGLSVSKLRNLAKVLDNINNGYFPSLGYQLKEDLQAVLDGKVESNAVERAKPRRFSMLYARVKALMTRKNAISELIRRNPTFNIDQLFGDYKTKDLFNSLFSKAATGVANYMSDLNVVQRKVERASSKVRRSKKIGNDGNKFTKSAYEQMVWAIQNEFLTNPGSKQVNSVDKWLKATIKRIDKGTSQFSLNDAEVLQGILNEYYNTETKEFDNDALYESFNRQEKASIETIAEINAGNTEKAVYTKAIIRGDKIVPLNNNVHINVLNATEGTDISSGPSFAGQINDAMRPSTRGGNLEGRTGLVTENGINFNIYDSALKGSKQTLMDFHMTSPIRTARKTMNQAEKNLEDKNGRVPTKQRDILNAINAAFEEATSNLLINAYSESSLGDAAMQYLKKTGYRTILAGSGRFVAELTSNASYAMIVDPKGFIVGTKVMRSITSEQGPQIARNLGWKNQGRLYADGLSGRMIDSDIINEAAGRQTKGTRSGAANFLNKYWNKTGQKYVKGVEFIADTMISTPDKLVMRPITFGSFDVEFKRITGKSPDYTKIAANDEAYMSANKAALEAASEYADKKSVFAGATDNAFMGILKGTSKPNQSVFIQGFNAFNNFMTRFLIYEYVTARTGIVNMVGRGDLSKREGAALLAGVTSRMMLYTLIGQYTSYALTSLFDFEDEEEDEEFDWNAPVNDMMDEGKDVSDLKSFDKILGQSFASAFTSMLLGRDFGNVTKSIINIGVEEFNKEQLGFLRDGDYDAFRDSIQYTVSPKSKDGGGTGLADYLMAMGAAFGPIIKTADLLIKKITEPVKKTEEARERQLKEIQQRIPLEILGNLGMIPMYKDVRKVVLNNIYKDLRQAKIDATNKKKIKEEMLQGYNSESDMKRYDRALWEDTYGPNSPGYDERQALKTLNAAERKLKQQMKDELYDYTAPIKNNNNRRSSSDRRSNSDRSSGSDRRGNNRRGNNRR